MRGASSPIAVARRAITLPLGEWEGHTAHAQPSHLSPAQRNRLAACYSRLAVYRVYLGSALGSAHCRLYQDRLIVTASPTYSTAPTARHTAAQQPAAPTLAQNPIQGSGRHTHTPYPHPSTPDIEAVGKHERAPRPICTHVHHASSKHNHLHDTR
jgi:hypothetical protein